MSLPDEEFAVLGEDKMALLTRRFERMHENRVNTRRNTRACPVRQARTLRHRLPREGREQGRLQAQVEDGWQVPTKAQPQEQAKGLATIEEEGGPRQGPSDGWNERRRL
jgi:hypothetical protein